MTSKCCSASAAVRVLQCKCCSASSAGVAVLNFDVLLDHLGSLGAHSETFGYHLGSFGAHLGPLGDHFGALWNYFGSIFVVWGSLWEVRGQIGPKGRPKGAIWSIWAKSSSSPWQF